MYKRILIVLILVIAVLSASLVYLLFVRTRDLTGIVSDASTKTPVEGAVLKINGQSAVTDSQGLYVVAIPRGSFTLTVQADGYEQAQLDVNASDVLAPKIGGDVVLSLNRVTGHVRDVGTQQPLPNARVFIGDKALTANAQGVFAMQGVKFGSFFAAQVPGYQTGVVMYNGQPDLDLPLTPNTVNVRVVDKYTNKPLAKAQVQYGDMLLATDANGWVAFHGVPMGAHLHAVAVSYEATDASYNGQDFQIALRPSWFDGIVSDATTGRPISDTLVYFGNALIRTNAKGEFHLDNVPAKSTITFKIPGYKKLQIDPSGVTSQQVKLTPFVAKGIHIPFGIAADQVIGLMDMVPKTELNAIVIDVKAEKGRVAWDTQVPLAKQSGAASLKGIDLALVVQHCRALNIYCIARFPVFQDNLLASARPDLAIQYTTGMVYVDGGGAEWINPYKTEAWDYELALAKEVVALGFDEIQFDYVRFPGRVPGVDLGPDNTSDKRIATISAFLARAQKELRPTGAFVSADVFGLTTATEDDQNTGQRLHDLAPYLDYVSPMVYPDTWVEASDLLTNGLHIQNCTVADQCPYDVIYNSYKRATEKTSTIVRPWLQAYAGHGNFGLTQYRLQKKAATDAGSKGWLFWNAQGIYDSKMFDGK